MANIIFDFDGTLADTLEVSIKIFEGIVGRGKPFTPEEIERLRGMSMLHIGAELRIPPWKVPYLLLRGRSKMRRQMQHVELFNGIPGLIKQLNADGHRLYVLSSNSVQNIRPLLKRYELHKEFIKLYGGAGLFGKSRLLRKVAKRKKFDFAETYYVGDEVRDIEAAKKASMKIISVTWGYNNEKILREHNPDFTAVTPAGIKSIFKAV